MLNETLIILKEHGPEAKVFYPEEDDQVKSENAKSLTRDENWLNFQNKVSAILIKNIFLRLVKKVYSGALASDEVLKALKLVSDLDVESDYCPAKVKNIVHILEQIIKKANQNYEIDEIREMISSLRFFEKTCGSAGGK